MKAMPKKSFQWQTNYSPKNAKHNQIKNEARIADPRLGSPRYSWCLTVIRGATQRICVLIDDEFFARIPSVRVTCVSTLTHSIGLVMPTIPAATPENIFSINSEAIARP